MFRDRFQRLTGVTGEETQSMASSTSRAKKYWVKRRFGTCTLMGGLTECEELLIGHLRQSEEQPGARKGVGKVGGHAQ